jgi:uncharacterized membrane protein YdjX (TVP38/TMEM64 family)
MTGRPETPYSGLSSRLLRWAPLVVLIAVLVAVYASGALRFFSFATIAEHRDTLQSLVHEHWVSTVIGYALLYVAVVALSLPAGALLTIVGGFLFGWIIAAPATIAAATAGASILFLIARSSLGDVLLRRAGPRLRSFSEGFRSDSFYYLLFLRLVPVFPFWLVNIAPALFNMPLRTYVAATLLGIMPGTFAYAFLGSGFDSIIAAQRQAYEKCIARSGAEACEFRLDPGSLLTGEMIVAFLALGIIALLPVALRRFGSGRERARQAPE